MNTPNLLEAHGFKRIQSDGSTLTVMRSDGWTTRFHAFDLYENVPERLDQFGVQRLAGCLESPDAPLIESITINDCLVVLFNDSSKVSIPFSWLAERIENTRYDPQVIPRSNLAALIPYSYPDYLGDDGTRLRALLQVKAHGVVLLRDAPCEAGEVFRAIEAFGFVRETNYGRLFDVVSRPEATNLAYTRLGLDLHTDNPYRMPAPTLQLLHCIQASAGGETVLADGFAAAEILRAEDQSAFDLLSRYNVRFAWRDKSTILETRAPAIATDRDGSVLAIKFNHRSLAPLDLPFEVQPYWRNAYRSFARILGSVEIQKRVQLAPGDMIIFDNERMLHGRSPFAPGAQRWLQGAYADRDGLLSTIAVLINQVADQTLAEIEALFASGEAQEPYGEDLSIAQHMLQAAHLARASGASDMLVAAALLHDIGWPISSEPHETAGAKKVAEWFGDEVAAPIHAHVAAKRWLVAAEPGYAATLSAESKRTLEFQGGPMSDPERQAFEQARCFADAVRLRRLDDKAKDPKAACPPLVSYRTLLLGLATKHAMRKGDTA